MMRRAARVTLAVRAALLLLASSAGLAAQQSPRQVLLLYSYERDFAPQVAFARLFRPELQRKSREPVEFIEISLQTARASRSAPDDSTVGQKIRAMVAGRRLDLVVPIGGPAAWFAQRNREQLFPEAALLLAGVDQRFVQSVALGDNDAAVPIDHQPARLVENILTVLPETRTLFVVVGASRLEREWAENMKRVFRRFDGRLRFSYGSELSFAEMVARCAGLPADSAILFAMLSLDAKGEPQVEDDALAELHVSANAPIFGLRSTQLGHGIVGGPLVPVEDWSRNTAGVALRILHGESPRGLRPPPQLLATPVFDARELRRWNIDESRLPPGSTIQFREVVGPPRYQRFFVLGLLFAGVIVGAVMMANLRATRRAAVALSTSRRRLMQVHQRERAAVAKELQDDLCQRMIALTIQLEGLSHRHADRGDEEIRRSVEKLSGQLADLAAEIFTVSNQLCSSKLQLLGLAGASRFFCREMSAQHGVVIEFHDHDVPQLPNDIALSLFDVMQEVVRSAVKHPDVERVLVTLRGERDEIGLEVACEGAAIDCEAVIESDGVGAVALSDRLSLVGGKCDVESRPDETRIRARVPLLRD